MPDYDPAVRTQALARIIGPYLAVLALTLVARQNSLPLLLPTFMQDAPLVIATGAFTLMAGLVIITSHHHWTTTAAIAISSIGIVTALKGAVLMVAPDFGATLTGTVTRAPLVLLFAAAVLLLIGLWLSFVGGIARS